MSIFRNITIRTNIMGWTQMIKWVPNFVGQREREYITNILVNEKKL